MTTDWVARPSGMRVAWTRGEHCAEVAKLLGGDNAWRVGEDLHKACIDQRIDLLVSRRLSTFDLVPLVVPYRLNLDRVRSVTAAIAGGPHSPLAARVATTLADSLDVPAELISVVSEPDKAPQWAADLTDDEVTLRVIAGRNVRKLIDELSTETVLVGGAPGGSWVYRQLFGAGRQLRKSTEAGSVLVQSAPRRVFHVMQPASGVVLSPHLRVADALRIVDHAITPVAHQGVLVGMISRTVLAGSDETASVADVMSEPISVTQTDSLDDVVAMAGGLLGSAVPVLSPDGALIGVVTI